MVLRSDGSHLTFGYDSKDMLVRITAEGAGFREWSAEYDGLCRRITKTVDGARTEYFWDDDRLAAEQAPDGRLRFYLYPSTDALLPFMFIDYPSAAAAPEEGKAFFVLHDQAGLPVLIEDSEGHEAWRAAAVDPYGAIEVASGACVRRGDRAALHALPLL